jgi:hypothetical protein
MKTLPKNGVVIEVNQESFAVTEALRKFLQAPAIQERTRRGEPEAVGDYALVIRYCYRHSVEGILAMGYWLARAKAKLPHGQFGQLFASHPKAVDHPVPFSIGTAERLMAIAEHPCFRMSENGIIAGANSAPGPNLPSSWKVLYELSRLSPPALTGAIAKGQVHAEMSVKDARRLRLAAAKRPRNTAKPVTPWQRSIRRALRRALRDGISLDELRTFIGVTLKSITIKGATP